MTVGSLSSDGAATGSLGITTLVVELFKLLIYTKTRKPCLMLLDVVRDGRIAKMSQIKHLGGRYKRLQRRRWVAGNTNWY